MFFLNQSLLNNGDFKGLISLLKGNIISKLLLVIGTILLAKKYGSYNFGVFNIFLSYISIIPVISSFSLDKISTMLTGSKEIHTLFKGTMWITSIIIILFTGLNLIFKQFDFLKTETNYLFIILCGVTGLITAWNNSQNALFAKFKLFKQLSFSYVLASMVTILLQIFFYFIGLTKNGLIYGWGIGFLVSLIYGEFILKSRFIKFDLTIFKKNILQHLRIIKYSYPSESINILANNILPLLAISYFSITQVGVYSLASKILTTPLIILSASFSKIYFQKAVRLSKYDKSQLYKVTKRIAITNVIIILIYIVILNSIGIYLLNLFFDKIKWPDLRLYLLTLSFWIICRSAVNPISSVIDIIEKNHYSIIFNLYLLSINFIAIYLGIVKHDFIFCVFSFSIFSGFGYLVLFFFIFRRLGIYEKK